MHSLRSRIILLLTSLCIIPGVCNSVLSKRKPEPPAQHSVPQELRRSKKKRTQPLILIQIHPQKGYERSLQYVLPSGKRYILWTGYYGDAFPSYDGKYVALVEPRSDDPSRVAVLLFDVETRRKQRVAQYFRNEDVTVQWSQKNDFFLVQSGTGLFKVSVRDGAVRSYSMTPPGDVSSGPPEIFCYLSPNRARVAIVTPMPASESQYQLSVLNLETNHRDTVASGLDSFLCWSPDGRQLAYLSTDKKIHVVEYTQRKDRRSFTLKSPFPAADSQNVFWLPDNRYLFIAAPEQKGYQAIARNGEVSFWASDAGGDLRIAPDSTAVALLNKKGGYVGRFDNRSKKLHITHVTTMSHLSWPGSDVPVWSTDSKFCIMERISSNQLLVIDGQMGELVETFDGVYEFIAWSK